MMMEARPECITELCNLLQGQFPSQLEITILPDRSEEDDNDENYLYLKDGIHLGIHAPNIPYLAKAFRNEYYTLRSLLNNKTIDENHLSWLEKRLWDAITCLLLICPDHATAWSDRKRLLISDELGNCNAFYSEIIFLNLLFSQHSKAPNAWSHRKWTCKQIMKNNDSFERKHEYRTELLSWSQEEINTCIRIAEKYPKNYYAWTHRRYSIETVMGLGACYAHEYGQNIDHIIAREALKQELESIQKWLQTHVSDHSAAHYGGVILRLMIIHNKECKDTLSDQHKIDNEVKVETKHKPIDDVLQENMILCRDLIDKFASNEVIWIWRRISSKIHLEYLRDGLHLALLNQFVQEEIDDVMKHHLNKDCVSEKEDHKRCILFGTTYILWLLASLRRNYQFFSLENEGENGIIGGLNQDHEELSHDFCELEKRLIHSIGVSDDDSRTCTPASNIWSIKSGMISDS